MGVFQVTAWLVLRSAIVRSGLSKISGLLLVQEFQWHKKPKLTSVGCLSSLGSKGFLLKIGEMHLSYNCVRKKTGICKKGYLPALENKLS